MKNLLLTTALLLLTLLASATIFRVNNQPVYLGSPPCETCYSQVDPAIAAALPGDTIHVEGSPVQYSAFTLDKSLNIIGPGYFLLSNPGYQANTQTAKVAGWSVTTGASGSVISGLVQNHFNDNVLFYGPVENVIMEHCHVRYAVQFYENDGAIDGIVIRQCFVGTGSGASDVYDNSNSNVLITNLVIENCYLEDIGFEEFVSGRISYCVIQNTAIMNTHSSIDVFNNIILSNNASDIVQNDNTCANWYNNIINAEVPWLSCATIWDGYNITSAITGGATIGSESDLVVLPEAICPECYMGFGGSEIGVYGGLAPYQDAGIPDIPSIFTLMATPQAYSGGPIQLTIGARTNP